MLTMQTHTYRTDPRTGLATLEREDLFEKLVMQGEISIYLQHGRAYWADGNLVDELPPWAIAHLQRMSALGLKQVGWSQAQVDNLRLSPKPLPPEVQKKGHGDPRQLLPDDEAGLEALQQEIASRLAAKRALTGDIPLDEDEAPVAAVAAAEAPEDPRAMKHFALVAWARRHGIDAKTRDEILVAAGDMGLLN